MKTIIKGDEENKQTLVTFIIDWNEKNVKEKLNSVVGLFAYESED